MADEVIEYSSNKHYSERKNTSWSQEHENGLSWIMKMFTDFPFQKESNEYVHLAWEFEWAELEKQGVIGFDGSLSVSYKNHAEQIVPITVKVKLTMENKQVELKIGTLATCQRSEKFIRHTYELKLTPIRNASSESESDSKISDPKFDASELTDIALDVEGKKVHVCKKHLAIHSDYFRTLFFSDFKEKSMDEIPIVDVKYEDFIHFLGMIYPKAPLPNDTTSEKLLELADRFLMAGVTHLVELHLCNTSEIRLTKMIYLAEKYQMSTLFGKCVGFILSNSRDNCLERLKVVKSSDFYKQLSDATKVKILEAVCSY